MKRYLKPRLSSLALAMGLVMGHSSVALADGDHQITMQQADIRAFIDDVSIVTGRTFLVDPRVQGKVTISSEKSLSSAEVFEVFKNVMRVHGYTLIRTATGEYRITLLQGAAQDAPFVQNSGANGQFATTVIKLENVDAAEAAKLIKPVLHAQGILTANTGGKVIVITDFPENLRKAREIVAALDVNDSVMETFSFTNISASDAVDAIKSLGGARPSYQVVAVPNSNSLIIEGPGADIARLRPVIEQMDRGGAAARGAVSVIPLRYADGAELIETLTSLLPSYEREGQTPPAVAYEAGSNSLIISAIGETQQALEGIIRQLDIRRPQVLVEAIIVEISDTAAKELGVEFALSGINGSGLPFFGTNFSQQGDNLLTIAGAVASSSGDVTTANTADAITTLLGLEGSTIGGISTGSDVLFGAIINAVQTDQNSNILSTPFVTTLDNAAARFVVGQEIPITTGETLDVSSSSVFTTYDREEVGIKLNVLPQISDGDVIRLEITQEVSSIAGSLGDLGEDFITNTREIETTVLANNGEIIVLGGLIQDDEQYDGEQVPILGDLPVIGNLFKTRSRSRVRTNLMVFLRPTIIRNDADARPLTQQRLDYLRNEDFSQTGRDVSKIEEFFPQVTSQNPSQNVTGQ